MATNALSGHIRSKEGLSEGASRYLSKGGTRCGVAAAPNMRIFQVLKFGVGVGVVEVKK